MEFTFEDFKERAINPTLSKWEKIGFPNSYRENSEEMIFKDIYEKLELNHEGLNILDIGCGCSELVERLISYVNKKEGNLYLVDSNEMLNNINKELLNDKINLIPGYFPKIDYFNSGYSDTFDRILIYSVIQYVFLEQSIYKFIHTCINLLKPGGRILIGDIPNISARERFLKSEEGKLFKKKGESFKNPISIQHENQERIDDPIVVSIISRFRSFGCETYLLPQPKNLPLGNRREDILIVKR